MSSEYPTAAARAAATVLLLCGIAGCSMFKNNVEAQALIDRSALGQPAGAFFERYGPWTSRREQPDGSTEYGWVSALGATSYAGLDDRTCTLRLVADKSGRITVANLVQDMPGRTSTSRCSEIFKAP